MDHCDVLYKKMLFVLHNDKRAKYAKYLLQAEKCQATKDIRKNMIEYFGENMVFRILGDAIYESNEQIIEDKNTISVYMKNRVNKHKKLILAKMPIYYQIYFTTRFL